MHEMSIAEALVEQLVRIADENGMARIESVEIDVGAMQLVVPEALDLAFNLASEGTVAAGARLIQREMAVRAVCRSCGHEFAPEIGCYLCPECSLSDAAIVEGGEIVLRTVCGPEKSEQSEGKEEVVR